MVVERRWDGRIGALSTLNASESRDIGKIYLEGVRTLSISTAVTYNTSATAGIQVELLYEAQNVGVDTISFKTISVTVTAGARVQKTELVDCPETGAFIVRVKNLDTSYAATNIVVGASISRYPD